MDTLKRIEQIVRENVFEQKKKKPRLKRLLPHLGPNVQFTTFFLPPLYVGLLRVHFMQLMNLAAGDGHLKCHLF